VVHHCWPGERPRGEGPTDTDDRKLFRIRCGNPVDGTEGSYPVRNNKSGRTVETRVSICRIRRIEFVAVSDPLRSSAILELLNKLKIEIPGYTEDVSNPDLFQSLQQEITDCLFHRFRSSRLDERLSNTRDPVVPSCPPRTGHRPAAVARWAVFRRASWQGKRCPSFRATPHRPCDEERLLPPRP